MPPKKTPSHTAAAGGAPDKAPQLKGNEAELAVKDYLQVQNRPYNATDISLNMKNVSKTITTKALAALAEKGDVVTKTYGKQAIYWPKQDDQATLTEAEDSDKLKSEAAVLADEVKSLKAQLKNLTADRDKMASVPGTSELITLSTHLRDENEAMAARLASVQQTHSKGGGEAHTASISKTDLEAQSKHFKEALSLCRQRRRTFLDLMDKVLGDASKADMDKFLDDVLGEVPTENDEVLIIEQAEKDKLQRPVKKRKLE